MRKIHLYLTLLGVPLDLYSEMMTPPLTPLFLPGNIEIRFRQFYDSVFVLIL